MPQLEPRSVKEYHVFVASPGDMGVERRSIREFFNEYNRNTAGHKGLRFTVIDWEYYSNAGVGRPQQLISEQTLEEFKDSLALVVGVMGQRFGTPTGEYESGTEEEFEWAIKRNKKKGFPEIKFFFLKDDAFNAPANVEQIEKALEQFKKVHSFKERLRMEEGDSNLYYKEFTKDNFEKVLRNDLTDWLNHSDRIWHSKDFSGELKDVSNVVQEIEKACQFLQSENPNASITILENLRGEGWDSLGGHEKFRVLANLGHAYRFKGEISRAADFFGEAEKCEPNDEGAKALAALGQFLLGNVSSAWKKASLVLKDNPSSRKAMEVWILSAPNEVPFESIEAKTSDDLAEKPEIAYSLALRAMSKECYEKAEYYSRLAYEVVPDDAAIKSLLGQVLLGTQISRLNGLSYDSKIVLDRGNLDESIRLFSEAIEQYSAAGVSISDASTRVNRGIAYQLIGEADAAFRDFSVAFELAPNDPEVSKHYIRFLGRLGETDRVIELSRTLYKKKNDPVTGVTLAAALGQKGDNESVEEGICLLEELVDPAKRLPSDILREALFILMELYLVAGQLSRIKELVVSDKVKPLDEESLLLLQATSSLRTEEKESAISYAKQALSVIDSGTSPSIRKRLGFLFKELGMPNEVFQTLECVLEPNYIDENVRLLVTSAAEVGNDRFVLEFCRKLRENGIIDAFSIEIEIRTLVSYHDERRAIDILTDVLDKTIDEGFAKFVRLSRSYIALSTNRPEFVEHDVGKLPAVDEATPETGFQMVRLLTETGKSSSAANYAYELFRRFPDSHLTHAAVILSFGLGTERELMLENPKSVIPGVGVLYKVDGKLECDWCIIEESSVPKPMLKERGGTDPAVRELLGKAVGDEFVLNKGGIQERKGQITGIIHKLVCRFQDCLSGWEERFPSIPFVWKGEIGKDEDGNPDFSVILKSIDKRAEQIGVLEDVYRNEHLPIHTLSDSLGIPVLFIIEDLSLREEIEIKCCSGNWQDVELATNGLSSADAAVIECTALATLFTFDRAELLRLLPFKCVVASGTMEELRKCFEYLERRGRDHKVLEKRQDRYVLTDVSKGVVEGYRRRVEELIALVEDVCVIESGALLADVPIEERERLVGIFGKHGAESIVLAQGSRRILWTDDLPLGVISQNEYHVTRVWTQSVAYWLGQTGLIGMDEVDGVTVNLLGAGYSFTSMSATAFLKATKIANWNYDDHRLRKVFNYLGSSRVDGHTVWLVVGQSLKLLWLNASVDSAVEKITVGILDVVASRTDGETIIKQLRQSVDAFFGLDVVNASKVKNVIEDWRGKDSKLIIT